MQRVLVTGGAGFIGFHVVELLARRGHRVLVLDNLSLGKRENLHATSDFVKADLCNSRLVSKALADFRPETVIHLAAQANVRRSIEDPRSDAQTNILGGLNLLESCAKNGVRRLVFASSGGAIYGAQKQLPVRETAVLRPSSPYGVAKQTLEGYGRYYAEATGLEFVSLRLGNVFGLRQNTKGEAGVIAIFLECMRDGRSPVIFGDGSNTRDYVWVGDVARSFIAALSCKAGTYNIGTGLETRTIDIFRSLKKLTEYPGQHMEAPAIPGEVRRNCLDSTLARKELDWSPAVTFTKGLSLLLSPGERRSEERADQRE